MPHAGTIATVQLHGRVARQTLKLDYVYVHDRLDAQLVLAQPPWWFEDYNENHPHKGLQMKSPREFMRSYHQPTANCSV
jgi:putative transposase